LEKNIIIFVLSVCLRVFENAGLKRRQASTACLDYFRVFGNIPHSLELCLAENPRAEFFHCNNPALNSCGLPRDPEVPGAKAGKKKTIAWKVRLFPGKPL